MTLTTEISSLDKQVEDAFEDGLFHGAHIDCQIEAEFVTLACGKISTYAYLDENVNYPRCPLCWNAECCPVCGVKLRR